jgi:uncharacterized membrane protein YphA (DoxX/SURF4 family)
MKQTISVARILVGLLFIFSGLVKANDPHGLEYKMYEFFETWRWHQNYSEVVGFSFKKIIPFVTGNFEVWMVKHTLLTSVLMNAFEIIAGFALLIGWRIKLFSRLLLLLIIFFTFLTGYTYITGKPTNCGCFGDCLPISSKTSFMKDVVLTILIGFLFWKQKYIKPLFGEKSTTITMFGITLLGFGFQWYTLNYLPLIDCLPYKKGKNIIEQMKMPTDAVPDVKVITYEYIKGGARFEFPSNKIPADLDKKIYLFSKEYDTETGNGSTERISVFVKGGTKIEFTADKFPDDFNDSAYTIIRRYDKLIKEGKNNQPRISGFVLTGITTEDSTKIILSQPYSILLFCEDFSISVSKWEKDFGEIYAAAKTKNIPAYMITTKQREAPEKIKNTSFADIQVFNCDGTAMRTAARTNPCIYLLKEGTILGKWSWRQMGSIKSIVKKLPVITGQ